MPVLPKPNLPGQTLALQLGFLGDSNQSSLLPDHW
jgi:hypothetical protein